MIEFRALAIWKNLNILFPCNYYYILSMYGIKTLQDMLVYWCGGGGGGGGRISLFKHMGLSYHCFYFL